MVFIHSNRHISLQLIFLHSLQRPLPSNGNFALKKAIWKLNTAPKIKHFIWRLVSGSLAIGEEALCLRHISVNSVCKRCCQAEESSNHLFFECEYAKATWRASGLPNPILFNSQRTMDQKLEEVMMFNSSARTKHLQHLPLWILWRLWRSRNILKFQQISICVFNTLKLAKNDAREWMEVSSYTSLLSNQIQMGKQLHTIQNYGWRKPLNPIYKYISSI